MCSLFWYADPRQLGGTEKLGHAGTETMAISLLYTLSVYFLRELAYQIADQFRVFGKHIGLKDTVIVGGIGKLML